MSTIAVLSRFPVSRELSIILPHLQFKDLISETPFTDKSVYKKSLEKAHELQNAEIIIADFDLIAPHIHNLPKTKWIQGTWAGMDALLPHIDVNRIESLPLVTRFSGNFFGRLMSEYVIAQIVNQERQLFKVYENQKEKNWNQDGAIFNYRSLGDLCIGIMGIGSIGTRLARSLNFLGAKIMGYGRKSQRDLSEMGFISEYYTKPAFPQFLQKVDYLINVLPSTPESRGLLNGDILQNCREKGAILINIGRGSIISEDDLIKALNNKWLSAAILDVFPTEPLPKESLLWTMPQVKITPHTSGVTRAQDVAQVFKEHLKLFEENKPIPTTIDFKIGY